MKYLLHAHTEPVADFLDITLYVVKPNIPFRFENDFHAQRFFEHMEHSGVVYVKENHNDETGQFTLDIKGAIAEARERLYEQETAMVERYVRTQQEDRLRRNFPAMPPEGRTAEIIKKRNIDLGETYNLYPVGWGKSKASAEHDAEIAQLKEQNRIQAEMLATLFREFKQLKVDVGAEDTPTTEPDITIGQKVKAAK